MPVLGQYTVAASLMVLVWAIDIATGPELSFSIFYLLPIAFVAWYRDWSTARAAAFLSTLLWLGADVVAGHVYSAPAIQYWNALVRAGFFFIVAFTVSEQRRVVSDAERLARTDGLTGVANSRSFLEIVAYEIARQRRYGHPLSVAFLDCDDFKQVNDLLGHAAGDELLRNIAGAIQGVLRDVDVVARLGGDEFAILLPQTDAQAAATVCQKLRDALHLAPARQAVTFSIGLATYLRPPADAEELIHCADEAMYEAKKIGKNAARQRVIGETRSEEVS